MEVATFTKKDCLDKLLEMASNSRDGVVARLKAYERMVNDPKYKDDQGNTFSTIGEAFVYHMISNPEFFGCSPKPTSDQIDWIYKVYNDLPERSDKGELYPTDVQPSKRTLASFVKFTTPPEAFVELIDNIFDNYDDTFVDDISRDLEISILLQDTFPGKPDGLILIKENSGGVRKDKILPLMRLGHTQHDYKSIGTWGWGAKLAYHALGRDIEIMSRHINDDSPIALWYDTGWLDEPDEEDIDPSKWKGSWYEWAPRKCEISPESQARLVKGTTITIINKPKKSGSPQKLLERDYLLKYLSLAFAEKLWDYQQEGRTVSIHVSDGIENKTVERSRTIEEIIQQECSFFPGLSPVCVQFRWEEDGEPPLDCDVYVGLTIRGKTGVPKMEQQSKWASKGIYMWGNNRVFLDHITNGPELLNDFVYNYNGRALVPAYELKMPKPTHQSGNRLHIWLKFHSDEAKSIPWSAPRKVRFAKVGNPYIQHIERSVVDVAIGFAHFATKSWKASADVFLEPFTPKWNSSNSDERLKLLFPMNFPTKYATETHSDYVTRLKDISSRPEVQRILKCGVNSEILYLDEEKFNLLKKYGQFQFRRKDFVSEILRRMIAVDDDEYPDAELLDFWSPLFRRR